MGKIETQERPKNEIPHPIKMSVRYWVSGNMCGMPVTGQGGIYSLPIHFSAQGRERKKNEIRLDTLLFCRPDERNRSNQICLLEGEFGSLAL